MSGQWPGRGPWIIAPTSADADWQAALATLATASATRVAGLAVGAATTPGAPIATWTQLGDQPRLADTVALVTTLTATHGLVLIAGTPGLLVPAGRDGWTVTDLAAALGAPVVVVTGAGPDAANHTTIALGALDARGLAGAVVVTGGTTGDRDRLTDRLPLTPAGHIPAGTDTRALDRDTARRLLDPMLHASGAPPTPAVPARVPTRAARIVIVLVAVFITMSVSAVCLALRAAPRTDDGTAQTPIPSTQDTQR